MEEPSVIFVWNDEMGLGKTGVIHWKELGNGMKLSLENASRLMNDAQLLLANKRSASALALLVVAWEEIGKAVLLLKNYKSQTDVEGATLREIFGSHNAKQTAIIHNQDILWQKPNIQNIEMDKKLKASLRWTKETVGLYVNWDAKRKGWSCPKDDRTFSDMVQFMYANVFLFLPTITECVNEALKTS